MQVSVILVEPEYEMNIGYCARVMGNFGFKDLRIVNPKVKIKGEAVKYSKHAKSILKKAKITKKLIDAAKGCNVIVGTTAKAGAGREVLRNAISPREFVKRTAGTNAKIALLIGREGTGLNKKELEECDVIVKIPANEDYPTLNISHALAILLYEINEAKKKEEKKGKLEDFISKNERELIIKNFDKITDHFSKRLRSPRTVKLAFKRILGRGIRSGIEARAFLQIIKETANKLGEKHRGK